MFQRLSIVRRHGARFINYLVVGGLSAAVQFLALWVIGNRWPADGAFSAAYVLSVAAHYLLVRFWALPSGRRDTTQQFGEYLLTVAISYGINIGMFKLGHDVIGLSVMWAALGAVPPSTAVIFFLLNFRVFRTKS